VIVIQAALLEAVQVALACGSVTVTLPFPAAEVKVAEAGFNGGTVGAAPDCVTARVRPAMESDPNREAVEVFA
jgi:hypothetical protein